MEVRVLATFFFVEAALAMLCDAPAIFCDAPAALSLVGEVVVLGVMSDVVLGGGVSSASL
jgi:hypothetical protein